MPHPYPQRISRWSGSPAKRIFDTACVLLALPLLAPVALAVAAAVRVTSPGPVFFAQKRVGRHGRMFTIFKFRTILHFAERAPHPITTLHNQPFTPIGLMLRRWKLDELPQLVNVLLGHMSLVGPRPKIPEQAVFQLPCRPGLTGMATLAFAEEEAMLSRVSGDQLNAFYYDVVLPAKHKLDSEYLAHATLLSDLQLLAKSVLRRWDFVVRQRLKGAAQLAPEYDRSSFAARYSPPGTIEESIVSPGPNWVTYRVLIRNSRS